MQEGRVRGNTECTLFVLDFLGKRTFATTKFYMGHKLFWNLRTVHR